MRDREVIDSELRLLTAVRRAVRENGGPPPRTRPVDDLLAERSAPDSTGTARVTGPAQYIQGVGIPSGEAVGTPSMQIQELFAMQHLWTARHAARLCKERETQVISKRSVDTELRSHAMVSIFFAAAFLEALVNEVILGMLDAHGPSSRTSGIPHSTIPAFRQLWKKERQLGIRGKYQEALSVVEARQYDKRRDPAKGMMLVIELRNHFVHHQPEWRDIDAEHHFERALTSAGVAPNQQALGPPWFTNKALGAGIAEWSCDVSTRFARSWWKRIGLKGKFDASLNQLPPP